MKDLKYLFAYTVPLATLISFNSFGIGTYTAVFYAFVVLPVLDVVLGKSSNNLTESKREEKKLNNDKIKRIIKKSKNLDKRKNFFDSIIENFF